MDHYSFVWLKIGAAVAVVVTFIYGNFETKDHTKELLDHVVRIEQKVDSLLEKR